jgi:hypothetical protein
MYSDDFRRHPDGSIDFNFYRRRARRLRRQAMRQLFKRQKGYCIPLLAAAVVTAIFMATGTFGSSHAPEPTLAGEHHPHGGPT